MSGEVIQPMRAWTRIAPCVSLSVNTCAGEAIRPTPGRRAPWSTRGLLLRIVGRTTKIQRNCQWHRNGITIISVASLNHNWSHLRGCINKNKYDTLGAFRITKHFNCKSLVGGQAIPT